MEVTGVVKVLLIFVAAMGVIVIVVYIVAIVLHVF